MSAAKETRLKKLLDKIRSAPHWQLNSLLEDGASVDDIRDLYRRGYLRTWWGKIGVGDPFAALEGSGSDAMAVYCTSLTFPKGPIFVKAVVATAAATPAKNDENDAQPASGVGEYRSADGLAMKEGIVQARLSEAVADDKVRTVRALPGMLDTQGRVVRVLYHRADAIQHCKPKRTKAKSFPKAPRTNS